MKAAQPLLPFGDLPRLAPCIDGTSDEFSAGGMIIMGDKRRTDGRYHDTGMVKPYRPCPPDFRDRYLELGQSKELEEHYRTNWRCIVRWIDECGGEALRAARRARSGSAPKPNLRRKRYVLGRTLTPKGADK